MDILRRRASFWRNLEYSLDHLREDINAQCSEKWADENDFLDAHYITDTLMNALTRTRERYIEVLTAQVKEAKTGDEKNKEVN